MNQQNAPKIITMYDPPPIPPRQFDWTAVLEDHDLGDPTGFGEAEQEAIDDLKDILEND